MYLYPSKSPSALRVRAAAAGALSLGHAQPSAPPRSNYIMIPPVRCAFVSAIRLGSAPRVLINRSLNAPGWALFVSIWAISGKASAGEPVGPVAPTLLSRPPRRPPSGARQRGAWEGTARHWLVHETERRDQLGPPDSGKAPPRWAPRAVQPALPCPARAARCESPEGPRVPLARQLRAAPAPAGARNLAGACAAQPTGAPAAAGTAEDREDPVRANRAPQHLLALEGSAGTPGIPPSAVLPGAVPQPLQVLSFALSACSLSSDSTAGAGVLGQSTAGVRTARSSRLEPPALYESGRALSGRGQRGAIVLALNSLGLPALGGILVPTPGVRRGTARTPRPPPTPLSRLGPSSASSRSALPRPYPVPGSRRLLEAPGGADFYAGAKGTGAGAGWRVEAENPGASL
ncbi:hypothetical protein J1605_002689 [Eschrichtius robustus]|uniref:Uncharacterized protein n=1 Tax=Eschrichtius robustus TaxID=9764 RepID=A0AB34HVL0_ESCRO|nr:hypothetical protein J1605_002689 [Eschrichtius robustus]